MADVFISYSKARAHEASQLARQLGEFGFDVWWDTSLLPVGYFGIELDRQLDTAKAVIVIWSPQSIRSKWVRSEAAHGDRQDKLINTHTPEISNPAVQIPKPHEQTHSAPLEDIRAVIAALDFLGVPRSGAQSRRDEPGTAPEGVADADDRLFEEVEQSGTAEAYEYYLAELPEGRHAAVARFRHSELAPRPAAPVADLRDSGDRRGEAQPGPRPAIRTGEFRVLVGRKGHEHERWLKPGESIRDFEGAPEMVLVPPGVFWMGSKEGEGEDNERPRHEVTIAYPLLVGKFALTYDEWDVFDREGGIVDVKTSGTIIRKTVREKYNPAKARSFGPSGTEPVTQVSWRDCRAYADWLSQKTGKAYRLLSEAEWEYCCRAGTTTAYSFGDAITQEQANFKSQFYNTRLVGSFPANAFGLSDMHGNVWEWCEDGYHSNYEGAPTDGSSRALPAGAMQVYVIRGGGAISPAQKVRSAYRDGRLQTGESESQNRGSFMDMQGFRVARTVAL